MPCARGCCPDQLTHYRSIGISADAVPTRKAPVIAINQKEKRWERDMPAYRSLRKDGLQPKQIDGCADVMARAETKTEIEHGRVLNPRAKEQLRRIEETTGVTYA